MPQVALRLVEHTPGVRVAFGEAELPPDHPVVRRDVELVRGAEDRLVLLRIVGVEDLPRVDLDLPDDGPLGLERGVVRNGVRRLRVGRRPRDERECKRRGGDEPNGGGPLHMKRA